MRALTPSAKRWLLDALLYGLSASFAAITAGFAGIPLQRTWEQTARRGYLVATAVAVAPRRSDIGARVTAGDPAPCSRSPSSRLTAAVPLVIAAQLRGGR